MPKSLVIVCSLAVAGAALSARQQPPPAAPVVVVRPIEPPETPLPSEAASAGTTRFSFFAYGDTRGQADGIELQRDHSLVVDAMLAKAASLAATPFPVRFVIQGDHHRGRLHLLLRPGQGHRRHQGRGLAAAERAPRPPD